MSDGIHAPYTLHLCVWVLCLQFKVNMYTGTRTLYLWFLSGSGNHIARCSPCWFRSAFYFVATGKFVLFDPWCRIPMLLNIKVFMCALCIVHILSVWFGVIQFNFICFAIQSMRNILLSALMQAPKILKPALNVSDYWRLKSSLKYSKFKLLIMFAQWFALRATASKSFETVFFN